jgi:hypothetical protein
VVDARASVHSRATALAIPPSMARMILSGIAGRSFRSGHPPG